MESCKLNVLITTYNHDKYVREALEGALMQKTNFEFNIIVHDDASPDKTQEIILEYANLFPNKIITVLQEKNIASRRIPRYPYIKRYLTGDYIALCEGDDYWTDPNKLQLQVDFLEKNQEYVGSAHNVRVIDENYNVLPNNQHQFHKFAAHIYTRKDAEQFRLPSQTASIVYRNIWSELDEKTLELYSKCTANGDQKLALLLTQYGDIYCFEETMADYRKVVNKGTSWSARVNRKNLSLYSYRSRLEIRRFSKEAFGRDINNKTQRKMIYASALVRLIRSPSEENRRIISEINIIKQENYFELYSFFVMWVISYPIRLVVKYINEKANLSDLD